MTKRRPPTQERDGRHVLDLDRYLPYMLVSITNAISRGSSRVYLDRFGIGVVDWRVLASLSVYPNVSAKRVSELVMIDKGAVSRSLATLHRLGHITYEEDPSDPRRKSWRPTAKGDTLHDMILPIALDRENTLLRGIDEEDLEQLLSTMQRMMANLDRLSDMNG
ncbi:MarR family winged helix-turn-helix transcriptional regulator [Pelagovum pacificum]|uniref:Winged helix-turn-helix transcriptional regulator n=1 Tax=Pelagovum pacificum TaxID=2588711 RepID=A0A5C5GAD4_9RHOB|nr:MarR family winged helix-turn-helix transcriptional regulator [Pelagovum pacificum]QQA41691.1 winged helix-turn-helix transcriptional regulator [Pelagovum pacificum]TNY30968.1 winged helix-turn-helix transcriptional regulator [Pelagovum pacificum]